MTKSTNYILEASYHRLGANVKVTAEAMEESMIIALANSDRDWETCL